MTPGNLPPLGVTLTRSPDEIRELFPCLHDRHDVAELLEIPYMHLVHILYRSPHRYPYRKFEVPSAQVVPGRSPRRTQLSRCFKLS